MKSIRTLLFSAAGAAACLSLAGCSLLAQLAPSPTPTPSSTFYVPPGDMLLNVCGGSYTYVAYGCGGTGSGKLGTGQETHIFYCK